MNKTEKVEGILNIIWKFGLLSLAYYLAEDKNLFWVILIIMFAFQ